jgi:hypothetical protein
MLEDTHFANKTPWRRIVRLIACALALAVAAVAVYIIWRHLHWQARLSAAKASEQRCDKALLPLIDDLVAVDEGDIGYMPTVSGEKFLPSDDNEGELGMLILGGPAPEESPAMVELVRRGADVVPCLMAHLDDTRPTGLVLTHPGGFGGLVYGKEYSYNARITRPPVAGLNDEDHEFVPRSTESGMEQVYTVTVGDLCFVALGQIVNRNFSAVRYQPSMIVVINSPAHSPELLLAARYEWGALTPETHRSSLILDILQPDYPGRRTGAIERLRFYYPVAASEIDLEQFSD